MHNRKGIIFFGIIFCTLAGVLLHFAYEWSGSNKIVGYFSAVNESTWEHLKLLFLPVVVFTVFEWLKVREKYPQFLISRTIALVLGMVWIVVAFYTISGVIGKNDISAINIGIFVVGVIITFLLTEVIMKSIFNTPSRSDLVAFAVILILVFLFGIWTYNSPKIGLFISP